VHALSYLPIVRQIDAFVGGPVAGSRQFDLFAGTSTGAIVAAALKLGVSAAELIDLYKELARQVFVPEWPWRQLFHKYSAEGLRTLLAAFFSHFTGRPALTWNDLCTDPQFQNGVELVVLLWCITDGKTYCLSTNPRR